MPETSNAPIAKTKSLPPNVPAGSIKMQTPGGQPHWIPPANQDAAKKAGAVQVN